MKTLICFLVLTSLASVPMFGAPKAEDDVMAAMETYKQGMIKRDASTLEKVFHPDLTYSHSSGKSETKAEAIAAATKGPTSPESIDMSDMTVRVYGGTALVKGKLDLQNKTANGLTKVSLSVLHVFVKTSQGWQMVARQATRLNP